MADQASRDVDAIIDHTKAEVANELEQRHGPSAAAARPHRPLMADAWTHKPDKAASNLVRQYRY